MIKLRPAVVMCLRTNADVYVVYKLLSGLIAEWLSDLCVQRSAVHVVRAIGRAFDVCHQLMQQQQQQQQQVSALTSSADQLKTAAGNADADGIDNTAAVEMDVVQPQTKRRLLFRLVTFFAS